MELERDVERYLVSIVKAAGGRAVKFNPDAVRGMPDRIVMLPGGVLIWVELKKPKGGRLSEVQRHRHRELRRLGQEVRVVWSKEDADALLEECAGGSEQK